MNGDEHRELRESLGDYAIGRLPDTGTTAMRAHLDGCAECRAELDELSSVLPGLRSVAPDRLEPSPAPPPDLGDRIVAAAREERRPRRLARTPAATAAAVALVLGGAVGYLAGSYDGIPREPVAVQAMQPGVRASAVAIPHSWGVEIVLNGAGFRAGSTYRVVVESDGDREVGAGEFVGTGARQMVCNLTSSVLRSDASGFKVVDASGTTVLRGVLASI